MTVNGTCRSRGGWEVPNPLCATNETQGHAPHQSIRDNVQKTGSLFFFSNVFFFLFFSQLILTRPGAFVPPFKEARKGPRGQRSGVQSNIHVASHRMFFF